MSRLALTAFGAIVVASTAILGMSHTYGQTPVLPKGTQGTFDTVEATVLKVFSVEQRGHRFIAYLVKWNDFDVIVSDPLARSNFREGDTIEFLAQRISLKNAPVGVSTLNFTLLSNRMGTEGVNVKRASDSESPEERKRQMKIAEGDLNAVTNEVERFYALNRASKNALKEGKTEEAQKLANELLEMARARTNDWNFGNAIQDSNQVLGRIALAKGDLAEAKKRLLDSADSKGSPQMNSFGPNMRLAKELLGKGETEVVLEYFSRCRAFWKRGDEQLASWTESVTDGKVPDFGVNFDY